MKMKRFFASAAAVGAAVSLLALSAAAYDIDKDFRTGWSISATVPASEFEELTGDSVLTLTYTADPSLEEMEGHSYWVVKPMINDAGWPLIENIVGLEPSEDGSSYVVPVDGTEVKFSITDESVVEHLKVAGMAMMGHGVAVGSLTISNDETLPAAPAASAEAPAAGDVAAAVDSSKGSPDTGVEDVAVFAGLAIAAGGVLFVSKKRK